MIRIFFRAVLICSAGAALSSCTKKSDEPAAPLSPAAKGKQVYLANCIACHNTDPRQVGVIGPAVSGSSLELLRARIMKAEYPPGYKPKRESKAMAPLPHLEKELENLQAFLIQP